MYITIIFESLYRYEQKLPISDLDIFNLIILDRYLQ